MNEALRTVKCGDGALGARREAQDERSDHDHRVEFALTLEPAVLAGKDGDELGGKKELEVGE